MASVLFFGFIRIFARASSLAMAAGIFVYQN